jgi:hypothetical protein
VVAAARHWPSDAGGPVGGPRGAVEEGRAAAATNGRRARVRRCDASTGEVDGASPRRAAYSAVGAAFNQAISIAALAFSMSR